MILTLSDALIWCSGLASGAMLVVLLVSAGDAYRAAHEDAVRWRALDAELRGQGWQCVTPQLIAARLPPTFPSQGERVPHDMPATEDAG